MAPDRPVGSVSGAEDWAWNRWQADLAAARERDPRPRDRAAREEPARTERHDRRDRLETRLERQQHRTQTVITQYERLLSERDRRLDQQCDGSPAGGLQARVAAAVRRLTAR